MPTILEALQQAIEHHKAGQLPQAEQLYRQILAADPARADAWHLLGVIALEVKRYDIALDHIQRAIALFPPGHPRLAAIYSDLGLTCERAGHLPEAVVAFQRAVEIQPDLAEAHHDLGNTLRRLDRFAEAEVILQRAVELRPDLVEAHFNLANSRLKLGKIDEAVASYRRVIELDPTQNRAYNNMGAALFDNGRQDEGMACYEQALRINPDYPDALANLANGLTQRGRLVEAEALCRRAIQVKPEYALAYNNLGSVLKEQSRLVEAAASLQEALRIQPDLVDAYNNLGAVYLEQTHLEPAIKCFEEAVRLRPDFAVAHGNLATALGKLGLVDRAQEHYRIALQIKPNVTCRLLSATLLPPVYRSQEELLACREWLIDQVRQMRDDGVQLDPSVQMASNAFYLTYQGFNDREIMCDLASLLRTPPEIIDPRTHGASARGGKIKVGFLSRFLKNHTMGELMSGLIAFLSRDKFSVTVISVGAQDDEIGRLIQQQADEYLEVSGHLPTARRAIANLNLDVLFYTDIGMEPITYTLAFSRLAPVQCTTWGHPETTGIPAIDYFISSELFETEASDEHYSEQLVRFKTIPAYCFRPQLPQRRKTREEFGFPADAHLYACPQTLFKFHPQFDPLLAGILRRDPRGLLLLPEGTHPFWARTLADRFARAMPDVVDRIRWLPRLSHDDYLCFNTVCEVQLDTLHFNGGNTSYKALGVGAPIVTLSGEFLRSRITTALYRKMGVEDCMVRTPDEYIDLAVRLACEPEFRQHMSDKILAANDVLYADMEAVRELEQFFEQAVAKVRQG
jgi:protein O-GlcNAc transferase